MDCSSHAFLAIVSKECSSVWAKTSSWCLQRRSAPRCYSFAFLGSQLLSVKSLWASFFSESSSPRICLSWASGCQGWSHRRICADSRSCSRRRPPMKWFPEMAAWRDLLQILNWRYVCSFDCCQSSPWCWIESSLEYRSWSGLFEACCFRRFWSSWFGASVTFNFGSE